MAAEQHTILLGGVGGDAHSVGLTILRQALTRRYRVLYIGPQSDPEDFFHFASISNVVMISCMDGHAEKYLREFPEFMQRYPSRTVKWYLGGNPALGEAIGSERHFMEMGFDRVFCRFVDVNAIFDCLVRDLHGTTAATDPLGLWEKNRRIRSSGTTPSDHRLEEKELHQRRREVLESWRTGAGARDLDANAEFLSRQPSFAEVQARQKIEQGPLLQPRSGVALVDDQIKLFQAFKGGGADTLSYQVDSLTRNNNYIAAEEGIRESSTAGGSSINGFPVVNHGVEALRRTSTAVGLPIQTRHSTRAPELLAEISYAGGVTAYEGGAICYNVPYYKDYSLADSIRAWQYVDRLTGLYAERYGIVLDREFFGTLTAALVPPSIAIASGIIESLLAASQGVRCVSVGYAEQGHRIQDAAAIRTIRTLVPEILARLGYPSVQVNAIFHQYMAAFPADADKAKELIRQSATTAALAGATRMLTKTAVEAYRIPSMLDNLEALGLTRQGISEASKLSLDAVAVAEEEAIIRREVECILEGVFACGHGSLAAGVVNAFDRGILDIPFAPSIHCRGEVMTARDQTGAVRFLDPGQLPIDSELKAFHRDRMSDRCHAEGLTMGKDSHMLVERDVLQIARGEYDRWPLGGT
ncbi:MAG: methylaspartate mutase subunit E [Deltaproteobacteria bacterium]|nr:methylaspartate mutase subunit E [Deltaproteobacteria bacterium]